MIQLVITDMDEKKLMQITHLLLKEELITDVNLNSAMKRVILLNDKLSEVSIYQITAKTRSSLFTKIEELIHQFCEPNVPELHSLPIIQMDWNQAKYIENYFSRYTG